jgi:hypothetical protein
MTASGKEAWRGFMGSFVAPDVSVVGSASLDLALESEAPVCTPVESAGEVFALTFDPAQAAINSAVSDDSTGVTFSGKGSAQVATRPCLVPSATYDLSLRVKTRGAEGTFLALSPVAPGTGEEVRLLHVDDLG